VDEAAALEAQKEAEKALANKTGEFEYSRAAVELAEAAAQLRTLQKLRKNVR
jgi:F-type H+-transporting ATPase subunit epsilon